MDQGKGQLNPGPHAGSEQVRANIDATRQAMDRTIDALEGKLTPGQLLVEGLSLLRSGTSSGANKLIELAREHPVPAAVIGVGVGMMLREMGNKKGDGGGAAQRAYTGGYGYEPSTYRGPVYDEASPRDKVREATPSTREAVDSAREKVSHTARDARDSVAATARDARDAVKETAHTAREAVGEAVDTAREKAAAVAESAREKMDSVQEKAAHLKQGARAQVHDTRLAFWRAMDEQPLVVGAAAIAVGLVAGLLIPATQKEDDLLGEKRDDLLQRAQEKGREVLEKGKQVAQTAVQTVKSEASQQGLSPADVAEKVKTIGREAVESAKAEAEKEGLTSPTSTPPGSASPAGSQDKQRR